MTLNWEAYRESFSGWRPVGHPTVNIDRLKSVLPSLTQITGVGDALFRAADDAVRAAQKRIRSGNPVSGDHLLAILHARGQRDTHRVRELVLGACSADRLEELAAAIGDLFCIDVSGTPQSCIRFCDTYVELLEFAACSERGGTGEGSLSAEAAFDLGVHWHERRKYERAVYWWHRSYQLGLWEGACSLAVCFMAGQGVPSDPLEAARWFMKVRDMPEARGVRWFEEDDIPVEAAAGWVRNGPLLAALANALTADRLPQLVEIIGESFDRLVMRTREGYVPLDQDDQDPELSMLQ